MFDGSGEMVFRSNGTLWGRGGIGGKGDFETVAMLVCLFKLFRAPKSSAVLGKS